MAVVVICGADMALSQDVNQMDDLAGFVDSTRQAWNIPGLAVVVVKDGRVMFMRGFGLRDAERELPVSARTIFPLGSTSKSFTALALAMLAQDGLLELDTPVAEAVPGFRLFDRQASIRATARDLLSHRSGLPGQYDMLWLLTPMSRDELFARLVHLEPNAALRERFQYSNVGYSVSAVILERLSAVSWEEFLTARIFQPLAMERTGFVDAAADMTEDRSQPYRTVGGVTSRVPLAGSVAFENVSLIAPAGGISSTAEDMARWLLMHLRGGELGGKRIIAEERLADLFAPQVEMTDPGYRLLTQAEAYGLGWAVSDYRGHHVMNHGGNIEGFSSLVSIMPDINAGIAVLSNTMNLIGYDISQHVYDFLLQLDRSEESQSMRGVYAKLEGAQAEALRIPAAHPDAPQTLALTSYAGVYENPAFGCVDISASGGTLVSRFESGVTAELQHIAADTFKGLTGEFYLPAVEVRFVLSDNGVVEGFTLLLQADAPVIRFIRRDSG